MNHHYCISCCHTVSHHCTGPVFGDLKGRDSHHCSQTVCDVCTSPQPSLNQEGRSEKRLRSTTSVFLLCVRETPDGCLSCSHANASPGAMTTAGPHMQKAEVSQYTEEVIGF